MVLPSSWYENRLSFGNVRTGHIKSYRNRYSGEAWSESSPVGEAEAYGGRKHWYVQVVRPRQSLQRATTKKEQQEKREN
jgi:hypothetical protein